MAGIKNFQELVVRQKNHSLALLTYETVKSFPNFEEFGLANQMRRSSVSIPSNIAEGFKRKTAKILATFILLLIVHWKN